MGNGTSNNLAFLYSPPTGTPSVNDWVACANAPFTPGTGFAMSEGNANQAAYVLAGGSTAFVIAHEFS